MMEKVTSVKENIPDELLIICGTGHRPDKLGGYTDEAFDKLYMVTIDWLRRNRHKIKEVISGFALGWDQALAKAAIDLGIDVTAAIPCDGQENKWSDKDKKRYYELLAGCKKKVVVSPGPYMPWKMSKRNEWMVDHSGAVLAMWDGTPGGTYNCCKYAKRKRVRIINLYTTWRMI